MNRPLRFFLVGTALFAAAISAIFLGVANDPAGSRLSAAPAVEYVAQ